MITYPTLCSPFVTYGTLCHAIGHHVLPTPANVIPHPSMNYRQVFKPIYYFQPSPFQSDLRHFHFNFPCFSFLPRVLRFWVGVFYPRFYPILLRLWLRWGQELPFQDPALFLPAQSCPFRLTHELELLVFELQDHWFINCASEPRSIELKLNYWISFACSKVICKDY